jgi:hypothetical protein
MRLATYVAHVKEIINASNIVVEWSTLLDPIQEVPDSNLGLQTGYPD